MKKIILFLFLIIWLLFFPYTVIAEEFNQAPTRILIPAISLDLPVFTAQMAYNTWEVRLDGASFGEHTTYPGNIGNTVVFSHARPGLFIDLPNLHKGDYIHVFTTTDWFVYKVTDVLTVNPENTDVIQSKNRNELTLFTCTGTDYLQRFVVKALLTSNPQNSF